MTDHYLSLQLHWYMKHHIMLFIYWNNSLWYDQHVFLLCVLCRHKLSFLKFIIVKQPLNVILYTWFDLPCIVVSCFAVVRSSVAWPPVTITASGHGGFESVACRNTQLYLLHIIFHTLVQMPLYKRLVKTKQLAD